MANPLSPALARTDYVLGKLRQARMLDAVKELAERPRVGRLANEVLQYPAAISRAEQMLGDHGMDLGGYLGAGAESIVFEAMPRSGQAQQVLKLRPGPVEDFDFPEGVPGIAPYWSKEQVSPMVAAALQPRGDVVWGPGLGLAGDAFDAGRRRLRQSLAARGWDWGDSHERNIAVMPDGTWAAIDGFLDEIPPADPFVDLPNGPPELELFNHWRERGTPRATKLPSSDDAIRMLRLTPQEQRAVYRTR